MVRILMHHSALLIMMHHDASMFITIKRAGFLVLLVPLHKELLDLLLPGAGGAAAVNDSITISKKVLTVQPSKYSQCNASLTRWPAFTPPPAPKRKARSTGNVDDVDPCCLESYLGAAGMRSQLSSEKESSCAAVEGVDDVVQPRIKKDKLSVDVAHLLK